MKNWKKEFSESYEGLDYVPDKLEEQEYTIADEECFKVRKKSCKMLEDDLDYQEKYDLYE